MCIPNKRSLAFLQFSKKNRISIFRILERGGFSRSCSCDFKFKLLWWLPSINLCFTELFMLNVWYARKCLIYQPDVQSNPIILKYFLQIVSQHACKVLVTFYQARNQIRKMRTNLFLYLQNQICKENMSFSKHEKSKIIISNKKQPNSKHHHS